MSNEVRPESMDQSQAWRGASPGLHQDEASGVAGQQATDRQTLDSGSCGKAIVAVACVACRSRHLKCDGAPRCGRCLVEGIACSYVKSRRGWKGPRRAVAGLQYNAQVAKNSGQPAVHRPILDLSPALDSSILNPSGINSEPLVLTPPETHYALDLFNSAPTNQGQIMLFPPASQQVPTDASGAGLINAFYAFFFPAHPFLLPHRQMMELLKNNGLPHLELALQYIGSYYVSAASSETCMESLRQCLLQPNLSKDGTVVQAMLLFAVGLHMGDKEEQASTVMYSTLSLAMEIGMNHKEFAYTHAACGTALEESWRRTWWELFIIDGMLAGVNQSYKPQFKDLPADMPLPCEDSDYLDGKLPQMTRTLRDYDDSVFDDDETIYPSSAYRIDSVRLLGKVLTAVRSTPTDHRALDLADTHLTNWTLHLPAVKRKPMDRDGTVDEVLFAAHMMVAACSILLHRPRSDLSFEDVKDVTSCVNNANAPLPGLDRDLHTAKAMQAAKDICSLIKLPCPLVKHTPFFPCAVTMGAVVYLSYWSFIATESGDSVIKEHIRLNIGVLKTLANVLPIAKTVLGQVKGVAQELFASRKALNNTYWSAVTREEILQGMIEEVCPDDGTLEFPEYLTVT